MSTETPSPPAERRARARGASGRGSARDAATKRSSTPPARSSPRNATDSWPARSHEAWPPSPTSVAARLDGLGGRAALSRRSTRPASSSTRTSGGPLAAGGDRGRRGRRARLSPPRARPRSGRRGARFRAAEEHLIALTGAQDALVTNNNAAARRPGRRAGRARRRRRCRAGELVEIGGGVRIPEIIRRAGAKLIEVGTTNRTRADDYEPPLAEGRARVVLRVHPSNFRQTGFTETPDPRALADLAHRPRRDRRRRSRLGRAPADRALRARPRADARRAAGRRRRPRDVQRRQARRGPAGRPHRRPGGPDRADPARPAGAGDAARQGDARGRRGDARALSRRPGRGRDPRLADDRRRAGRAPRAGRSAGRGRLGATGSRSCRRRRRSGAARCPGEMLPSFGLARRRGSAERTLAALRRGSPAVVGRIEGGRVDPRPPDGRSGRRRRSSRRRSARSSRDRRPA